MLAFAPSYTVLLAGAAMLGIGSSIFHPESSRIARMASGGAHGLAQSLFQVGGNFGSALGPLLAAFFVLPRGQNSLAWFALAALGGMAILTGAGALVQQQRPCARPQRAVGRRGTPRSRGGRCSGRSAVLIALIFSKYFYLASFTSYYIFYLMHRFHLSTQTAQVYLFVFLAAAAAGTIIGGPVGDRFGRKTVIWGSILGVLPFTLALPYVGLTATVGAQRDDRARAVLGLFGDRRLCAGADAGPGRHGLRAVLRVRLRHGRHRRSGARRVGRLDEHRVRLLGVFVSAADRRAHGFPPRRGGCVQIALKFD